MKPETKLTIFADGQCPLCVMEMSHLKEKDALDQIKIEDINASDFTSRYPDIDKEKASQVLHATLANGELLLGLDVSHKAWSMVGRPYYFGLLRLPVIRWISDKAYRFFAKNRYGISKLLTGKARLEDCSKCRW